MFVTMLLLFRCLVGPKVTKKYEHKSVPPKAVPYERNGMETCSAFIMSLIMMLLPANLTLVPVYIYTLYLVNGFYDFEDWLLKYMITFIPVTTICMYVLRTIGRARNPVYKEFMTIYHSNICTTNFSRYVKNIRKYDFDFSYWPVTFSVEPKLSLWKRTELIQHNPFTSDVNKYLGTFGKIWTQMVAFALAHSFTIRIIFPGTATSMQTVIREELDEGRDDYIIQYNGERAKISTADGYHLDAMYVNLEGQSPRGHILVICCEGNCNFYENGIMNVPVNCGYSALGWNQPGFANSTGNPFPRKLRNAIDAVMKYATEVLRYSVNNIVMYGWSMGGYTATWAGIHYPGVKGVILDAAFDDLFLIIKKNSNANYTHVVREVIRCYMDIDIGKLLMDYNGPLVIIRHTLDEVNSLENGRLETNRSNALVVKVITKRYPEFSGIEYISMLIRNAAWEENVRNIVLKVQSVPEIKKCMFLVSKFMKDFKAAHNVPLPDELFFTAMKEIQDQNVNKDAKVFPG